MAEVRCPQRIRLYDGLEGGAARVMKEFRVAGFQFGTTDVDIDSFNRHFWTYPAKIRLFDLGIRMKAAT